MSHMIIKRPLHTCLFACLAFVVPASQCHADGMPVAAPDNFTPGQGVAGSFAYAGTYLNRSNDSVTRLSDGRLFLYGAPFDESTPRSVRGAALRSRLATRAPLDHAPSLWSPARRAWERLPEPPECKHDHLLASVSLLHDGKVLVAGGQCDEIYPVNEPQPARPYTALSLWNSKTEQWESAPHLAAERIFHTASVLPDDSVLIVGGERDPREAPANVEPVIADVERFQNGRIDTLAPLHEARARHSATVLNHGSLLVAGGIDAAGKALTSVELWNPARGNWQAMPPLAVARYDHSAVLLDDGRVMVVGGADSNGKPVRAVEIWDPRMQTWSAGQPLRWPEAEQNATRLANGNVLLIGRSRKGDFDAQQTQLWQKDSASWAPAGTRSASATATGPLLALPDGRAHLFGKHDIALWTPGNTGPGPSPLYGEISRAAITPLADGRVLVSGGLLGDAFIDSAELFDPASGRFTLTGRMHFARHSHTGVVLDDGRVVVAGGWARSPADTESLVPDSPEVWDPVSGKWSVLRGIDTEWRDHVLLGKLDDGSVMFFAIRERALDQPQGPVEYRAWLWQPRTARVSPLQVPLDLRSDAAIAIRPNGTVFMAGGNAREFVLAYVCPPEAPVSAASSAADADEESGCKDEPAHWTDYSRNDTELWNVRSGEVRHGVNAPVAFGKSTRVSVLHNGDVLLTQYRAPNPYVRDYGSPVWRWQAANGTWEKSPQLSDYEGDKVLELADGSLLTDSMLLLPGDAAWQRVPTVMPPGTHPLALSDGVIAALSTHAPYFAKFDPQQRRWDTAQSADTMPAWRSPPALTELPDGRVMAVGAVDQGNNNTDSAYLWDPRLNTWTAAGILAGRYGNGQAMTLASGRVLYLGESGARSFACELWQPTDNSWDGCSALQGGANNTGWLWLGRLADGRPAVISGPDSVLVFDEGGHGWRTMTLEYAQEGLNYGAPVRPSRDFYARAYDSWQSKWIDASAVAAAASSAGLADVLWDTSRHEWAYVLPRFQGIGRRPAPLSDGCMISLAPPFRVFNPHTGKVSSLPDLGQSPIYGTGVVLLHDDTLVMIGGPDSNGLIRRHVSCAGYSRDENEPYRFTKERFTGTSLLPDASAQPQPSSAAASHSGMTLDSLRGRIANYKWLLLAVLGPALAYALLRRLLLPRLRALFTRPRGPWSAPSDPPRQWSAGFRWTIRIVLYGCAAIIGLPMALNAWMLHRADSTESCNYHPARCLDQKSGLLPPVSSLETDEPDSKRTRIPCRYVGIWSSIRPGLITRMTLSDDGHYKTTPLPGGMDGGRTYTGYWAVQGHTMLWRHDQAPGAGLDVNPIDGDGDGKFVLIEENGQRTRFELIEKIPSTQCVP